MITPRISLACLLGGLAFLALFYGVARGPAVAWWFLAVLVPPLVVFVWWMVDRAALEQRIRRLEARSEIGDERRIAAHTDLANVEQRLHKIEAKVAPIPTGKAGAIESGVPVVFDGPHVTEVPGESLGWNRLKRCAGCSHGRHLARLMT